MESKEKNKTIFTLTLFQLPCIIILIPDDSYHFDWSLEAHPDNAESGTMEGKNTDTLKLSHVSG